MIRRTRQLVSIAAWVAADLAEYLVYTRLRNDLGVALQEKRLAALEERIEKLEIEREARRQAKATIDRLRGKRAAA